MAAVVAAALVAAADRRAPAGGRTLRAELGDTPEVAERRSRRGLDAVCDATGYLGANDVLIDRALDRHARHARGLRGGRRNDDRRDAANRRRRAALPRRRAP